MELNKSKNNVKHCPRPGAPKAALCCISYWNRWCSSFFANPAPGTSEPRTPAVAPASGRRGLETTAEASRTGLAIMTRLSTIRGLLVLASSASCKRRS